MASACVSEGYYRKEDAFSSLETLANLGPGIAQVRTRFREVFDAVPFTPSQGVISDAKMKTMFSPFANTNPVLGGVNSDGSTGSDLSSVLPTSPVGGLSGYSPFMGVPWGSTVPNYFSEGHGASHLEIPESPMSPGVMFNPSPSPGGLGAPGSPRSLFGSHSPNPYGLNGNGMRTATGSLQLPSSFANASASANMAAAADAAAAAAAAAAFNQLPPFYYQAAAAAAAGNAGAAAANNLSLQAALSQSLMSAAHPASLAAAQQQQMQQQILQASLSAAFGGSANPYLQGYPSAVLSALEPMRSAGGSLSLDGGLQQQASGMAAVLLQHQQHQQHQHVAAQLRRNLSTPAAVAAHLGLSNAAAAASAQLGLSHSALTASCSGLPLTAQMGRLHVTHSADLTHLDAAQLLGTAGSMGQMAARTNKFKARKNSEPKIGPDGQPRLNARQRRTLRRAKERALKGLLEVSQALLQKAEVQVIVPNISHLTALEELAAVEAEKEAAAGGGSYSSDGGGDQCLSPGGSLTGRRAGGSGAPGARPGGQTRSQQLAAAAAAVEESVCEIARAAVAAVTAQATGKDTSSAAAAAHAAAANAASAAASAGAVLPPGFVMPETEEMNSEDLPGCDSLECLSHSAPTSPVGSCSASGDPSSGRSSSSSSSISGSLPSSGRCSSSSGSAASAFAGKPPVGQPGKAAAAAAAAAAIAPAGAASSSPVCSPVPSPTPGAAGAAKGVGSHLEGIDIAGLIGQLSLKKDEGMVDDKLIRDLQIIQSLIGALKAPGTAAALDSAGPGGCSSTSPLLGAPARGPRGSSVGGASKMLPKRANSYSPSSGALLHPSLPH